MTAFPRRATSDACGTTQTKPGSVILFQGETHQEDDTSRLTLLAGVHEVIHTVIPFISVADCSRRGSKHSEKFPGPLSELFYLLKMPTAYIVSLPLVFRSCAEIQRENESTGEKIEDQ